MQTFSHKPQSNNTGGQSKSNSISGNKYTPYNPYTAKQIPKKVSSNQEGTAKGTNPSSNTHSGMIQIGASVHSQPKQISTATTLPGSNIKGLMKPGTISAGGDVMRKESMEKSKALVKQQKLSHSASLTIDQHSNTKPGGSSQVSMLPKPSRLLQENT
jgi:hypothetical protein